MIILKSNKSKYHVIQVIRKKKKERKSPHKKHDKLNEEDEEGGKKQNIEIQEINRDEIIEKLSKEVKNVETKDTAVFSKLVIQSKFEI